MTRAAEQCREYIEAEWPGTPIGRFACRDTAAGYISQHSAYNGYDSNALDIFGPDKSSSVSDTAWIQRIVDDLLPNLEKWSGRKILWQIPLHYNHAHIDFYPMCLEHKWCGRSIVPEWEYSDSSKVSSIDPEPENGEYHGEDEMTYLIFRADEFDLWTDENIMSAWDRGRFEDTNRAGFEKYWVTDRALRTGSEKARFMTDFYSSSAP